MAGWASRLVDSSGVSRLCRSLATAGFGPMASTTSLSPNRQRCQNLCAVRFTMRGLRTPNAGDAAVVSPAVSAPKIWIYVAFSRRLIPNIPQTAPFRSLYVPLVAHSPLVAVEYRRGHSLRDKRGVSPSPTRRRVVVTALLACAAVAFAAPCATSAGSPTTGSNPAAPLWRGDPPWAKGGTPARPAPAPAPPPPPE